MGLLCAILSSGVIALLLPAVAGVARNSRASEVSFEITRLEQALVSFKARHGLYPPDHLTIPESGRNWSPLDRVSVRRLWPNFDFEQTIDLNRDGDSDDVITLSGAECLVFFLAGYRVHHGKLIGLSKNPVFPFETESGNRAGPYLEFDPQRLIDVDGDAFYEYVDVLNRNTVLPTPYLYVVKHDGTQRYGTAGLTVFPEGDPRNMTQAYVDSTGQGIDGFQVISPGFDGEYGVGGVYAADDPDFPGRRSAEEDNISSFSGGTLSGTTRATRGVHPIVLFLILFSPIGLYLLLYLSNGLFSIQRALSDDG